MEVIVKKFSELSTYELYSILEVRVAIFVVEQECPYAEVDGLDREAVHVWLEEDGKILAYLRVMDRGIESEYVSIGRLLAAKRREGKWVYIDLMYLEVHRSFQLQVELDPGAHSMPPSLTLAVLRAQFILGHTLSWWWPVASRD